MMMPIDGGVGEMASDWGRLEGLKEPAGEGPPEAPQIPRETT